MGFSDVGGRKWRLLLLLLSCGSSVTNAYIPEMIPPEIPSLYPLQYITPPAVFQYTVEAAISSLVPRDSNEALAIFVSEGTGGFFGGIASRAISRIDGNKFKKTSELLSGAGAGTYLGVAGAVRSLAYAAGASQLAVSLSALLTSVVIGSIIRLRAELIEKQQTATQSSPKVKMYDLMRFRNPTMKDLMFFRETGTTPMFGESRREPGASGMTLTEATADATQFTLLSLLVPNGSGSVISLEESVIIGAVAGLAAQAVREGRDRETEEARRRVSRARRREGLGGGVRDRPDYLLLRLARAAVEGAAQLLTYQAARDYVREVSPYFNSVELQPLGPFPSLLPPEVSFAVSDVDLGALQLFTNPSFWGL